MHNNFIAEEVTWTKEEVINAQYEIICKFGTVRAVIDGVDSHVNLIDGSINGKPCENLKEKILEQSETFFHSVRPVKWVGSSEYCRHHGITEEGLRYRKKQGTVIFRKNDTYLEYDIETPKKK